MENIRIVESCSLHFIAAEIGSTVLCSQYLKEMNEAVCWMPNQHWYLAYIEGELAGFICHDDNYIKYAYTRPSFRGRGVFMALYNAIPERNWSVMSSNSALPIYLKLGFTIVKSYKICHKLIKL